MRVLVTGGAGYIGSNLVDRLLIEGDDVVVVDNLSVGKLANLEHHLDNPRFRFVEGDILDEDVIRELIEDTRLVYHLAAVVGVKHVLRDPLQTIVTNVWGTERVLQLASERGCKVVVASSSEVYGKSTNCPLHEDDDRVLGPSRISRWSYAAAKALDEYLGLAYYRQKGLPVVIVRYFNSYGPRLDPQGYGSVIAKFIGQALAGAPITVHGDGQQSRCFTYVDDTVEGTVLAARVGAANGEILNIARDEETTILALAQMIKEATHSPSDIVLVSYEKEYGEEFEDSRRRVPAVESARRVLGFKAQVPLSSGLERTIRWFRGEG
jgi:UDP-glucose 4-epimerase